MRVARRPADRRRVVAVTFEHAEVGDQERARHRSFCWTGVAVARLFEANLAAIARRNGRCDAIDHELSKTHAIRCVGVGTFTPFFVTLVPRQLVFRATLSRVAALSREIF